jgi:hypothetical protein
MKVQLAGDVDVKSALEHWSALERWKGAKRRIYELNKGESDE